MNNFYPKFTDDGSVSLYNTDVNDIYHSSIGARKEAILKFIEPSGILEFVKHNNEVSILDICFGLGYNSKTAIDLIRKINPNCKIRLTCLELDASVLALSTLVKPILECGDVDFSFSQLLLSSAQIRQNLKKYLSDSSFNEYFDENKKEIVEQTLSKGSLSNLIPDLVSYFHNIYYRSVSKSNNFVLKSTNYTNNLDLEFYIGDARWGVNQLNAQYDYIFHDGFTPTKNPCVWTIDFIRVLFNLLKDNGNLTTYTSSTAVRSALLEVGFCAGETKNDIGKPSGTIATKNPALIKNNFSEKDVGLIRTNAGIVYRDNNFQRTDEHIIKIREIEQKLSGRMSSSKYLKNVTKFSK